MGQYHSPYLAMGNNPISMIDPTGGWSAAEAWDQGFDNAADAAFYHSFDGNHFDRDFENYENKMSNYQSYSDDLHEYWDEKDKYDKEMKDKTGKSELSFDGKPKKYPTEPTKPERSFADGNIAFPPSSVNLDKILKVKTEKQPSYRSSTRPVNLTMESASNGFAYVGMGYGAYEELIHVNPTTYTNIAGKNVEIFKANGQYNSPYAASKYRKVAWGVKGTGIGLSVLQTFVDGIGLYNYHKKPNDDLVYKVNPGTFKLNLLMTGVGSLCGPVGWGLSAGYLLLSKPDLNETGPIYQFTLTPPDALKVNH